MIVPCLRAHACSIAEIIVTGCAPLVPEVGVAKFAMLEFREMRLDRLAHGISMLRRISLFRQGSSLREKEYIVLTHTKQSTPNMHLELLL